MRRCSLVAFAVVAVLFLGTELAGAAVAAATTPATATSTTLAVPKTTHPGVRRVLVISLPTISWEDLDLTQLPNLSRAVRAERRGRPVGARRAPRAVARRRLRHDRRRHPGRGSRRRRRRVPRAQRAVRGGHGAGGDGATQRDPRGAIPGAAIVCLAQHEVVSRNNSLLFDAKVSALGDTLAAAGVQRAAIGNGDTTLTPRQRHRLPALGAARAHRPERHRSRRARSARRCSSAIRTRPTDSGSIPSGARRVRSAWNERSPRRAVVIVEDSDLLRLQSYGPVLTSGARAVMQQQMLSRLDAMVGELMKRVDPAHDAVLVVAPSQRGGPGRLTVASLYAPGVRPGLAVSSWTRHSGVVSIVDIGPTILDQLGIEPPARMEGRPITFGRTGGDAGARVTWLINTNKAAQFRDSEIAQVTVWFVVLQILLTVAGAGRVRALRSPRADRDRAGRADTARVPRRDVPRRPRSRSTGSAPVRTGCSCSESGAVIALIAWFTTDRAGVTTLIVALGILVGLIIVDVATGARLQFNTVFGYTPDGRRSLRRARESRLRAARVGRGAARRVGRVPHRRPARRACRDRAARRRDRGRRCAVLRFRRRRCALDGARVRGDRHVAARLAHPLAAHRALRRGHVRAARDLRGDRPEPARPSKRTHLGRLIASGEGEGGFHSISTMIERKMSENTAVLFGSIWTIMLPLVFAGIAYLDLPRARAHARAAPADPAALGRARRPRRS